MLGEQLVDYTQWDGAILDTEAPGAAPAPEPLGRIDDEEVRDFAERLGALKPSDLDYLARSLAPGDGRG